MLCFPFGMKRVRPDTEDTTYRVHITSRNRDMSKYPSASYFAWNWAHFVHNTAQVQKIKLINVLLPNALYNISETCNRFYVSEHSRSTNRAAMFMATVPVGNYTSAEQLVTAVTSALSSMVGIAGNMSVPENSYTVQYDAVTQRCVFSAVAKDGNTQNACAIHCPPAAAPCHPVRFAYNRRVANETPSRTQAIVPLSTQTHRHTTVPSEMQTVVRVQNVQFIPPSNATPGQFVAIQFTFTANTHNIQLGAVFDVELQSARERLFIKKYFLDPCVAGNWVRNTLNDAHLEPTRATQFTTQSTMQMMYTGQFTNINDENISATLTPYAGVSSIHAVLGFTCSNADGGSYIPICGIDSTTNSDVLVQLTQHVPAMNVDASQQLVQVVSGRTGDLPLSVSEYVPAQLTEMDLTSTVVLQNPNEQVFVNHYLPELLSSYPEAYPNNYASFYHMGVYISDQIASVHRMRVGQLFLRITMNQRPIGNIFVTGGTDTVVAFAEMLISGNDPNVLSCTILDMGWVTIAEKLHDTTHVTIELIDECGNQVNLHGLDWSFTLEITYI